MLSFIENRGPDEAGYYFDNFIGFGSTRLKIIDLKSGQQPLSDVSQRYWICYNGEIYNYLELREELISLGHSFTTSSDTEVLLYAWISWQEKALPKLNGAFAFAIYDSLEKSLFLGRDRYGKRPLYYYRQQNEIVFASEMKCFFPYTSIHFSFDLEKVASIFNFWTPLPEDTPFENIKQVPPGSFLSYKNNTLTINNYYDLDFSTDSFFGNEQQAIDTLNEKLHKSVELCLRSDVEVGTYLSGGIDSAIITKLACDIRKQPVKTFSISFANQDFNEKKEQQILSNFLQTDHTSLEITDNDIVDNFPKAVWHAEVPQFRTALVPMLLLAQEVKQSGIKVVLTGEGADESFLGYNIFKETALRSNWNNMGQEQHQEILSNLYPYLDHLKEANYSPMIAMYKRFLKEKTQGLFSHEIRFSNAKLALRLLDTQLNGYTNLNQTIKHAKQFNLFSPVQKAQWLEFKTLLCGYLLSSQGDRMSLAYGIENRCPFLDYNLVDWATSLPQNFKLKNNHNEKYILKQAFQNKLPKQILERSKQPYRSPGASAFLQSKHDYLETIFSEQEIQKIGFVNIHFYRLFIQKLRESNGKISPRENDAYILLLSLSLLHKWFIERGFALYSPRKILFTLEIDGRNI